MRLEEIIYSIHSKKACIKANTVVKVAPSQQQLLNDPSECGVFTYDLSNAVGLRDYFMVPGVCPKPGTVVKVGSNARNVDIPEECTGYTVDLSGRTMNLEKIHLHSHICPWPEDGGATVYVGPKVTGIDIDGWCMWDDRYTIPYLTPGARKDLRISDERWEELITVPAWKRQLDYEMSYELGYKTGYHPAREEEQRLYDSVEKLEAAYKNKFMELSCNSYSDNEGGADQHAEGGAGWETCVECAADGYADGRADGRACTIR